MANAILKRGRITVYFIGGEYYILYKGILLTKEADFKAAFNFLHKNYADICAKIIGLDNGLS